MTHIPYSIEFSREQTTGLYNLNQQSDAHHVLCRGCDIARKKEVRQEFK